MHYEVDTPILYFKDNAFKIDKIKQIVGHNIYKDGQLINEILAYYTNSDDYVNMKKHFIFDISDILIEQKIGYKHFLIENIIKFLNKNMFIDSNTDNFEFYHSFLQKIKNKMELENYNININAENIAYYKQCLPLFIDGLPKVDCSKTIETKQEIDLCGAIFNSIAETFYVKNEMIENPEKFSIVYAPYMPRYTEWKNFKVEILIDIIKENNENIKVKGMIGDLHESNIHRETADVYIEGKKFNLKHNEYKIIKELKNNIPQERFFNSEYEDIEGIILPEVNKRTNLIFENKKE